MSYPKISSARGEIDQKLDESVTGASTYLCCGKSWASPACDLWGARSVYVADGLMPAACSPGGGFSASRILSGVAPPSLRTASAGVVLGTGGIRRDCYASLALILAPEAIVGISLGPTLGPAAWSRLRITTVGRPSRGASQATLGTSAAWSASSRPRPAAMVLAARRTLVAAAVSTVGSALDQPAT
jgi:hypothetical protein